MLEVKSAMKFLEIKTYHTNNTYCNKPHRIGCYIQTNCGPKLMGTKTLQILCLCCRRDRHAPAWHDT